MPTRYALRVIKGGFAPADNYTAEQLRPNVKIGDVVFAEIKHPRNYKFWRLAHQLGTLIKQNIEQFKHLNAHDVLKRIQLEGDIACDIIILNMPGIGLVKHRVAKSLAFDKMEEPEFKKVYGSFCKYIAENYWPDMEPEQIERMVEVMPDEI